MGVGSRYVEVPEGGAWYAAELTDESGNRWESLPVRTPPGPAPEQAGSSWTAAKGAAPSAQ